MSVCHASSAFGYSLATACITSGLLKVWRWRTELCIVVIAAYFGILSDPGTKDLKQLACLSYGSSFFSIEKGGGTIRS